MPAAVILLEGPGGGVTGAGGTTAVAQLVDTRSRRRVRGAGIVWLLQLRADGADARDGQAPRPRWCLLPTLRGVQAPGPPGASVHAVTWVAPTECPDLLMRWAWAFSVQIAGA